MDLEESAIVSAAVDPASAAAAAAMTDLSDQASPAVAGQWTIAKLRQLAPSGNHADPVILCPAHRCVQVPSMLTFVRVRASTPQVGLPVSSAAVA
jgi:hypothetical protein